MAFLSGFQDFRKRSLALASQAFIQAKLRNGVCRKLNADFTKPLQRWISPQGKSHIGYGRVQSALKSVLSVAEHAGPAGSHCIFSGEMLRRKCSKGTYMTKRVLAICVVAATALSVSIAVLAQGGHGIPTPEKVYGDGFTWPIKVETTEYDNAKLLAPPAMSEDAKAGRILWTQRCAYCHDGVGAPTYRTMGPWLGAEVIQKIGEDNARSFIKNGDVRMPAFRYGLDEHQIDDLIAFIKTVPSSEKPTPAQLSGRGFTPQANSD
jgi:mono/diheme cytochrome c family protein